MTDAIRHRRVLIVGAVLAYFATFVSFLLFESPGLGIAHFYYLAIALLAAATGARGGALAGALATALYLAGIIFNPHVPTTNVPTWATVIRLLTFTLLGLLIGW